MMVAGLLGKQYGVTAKGSIPLLSSVSSNLTSSASKTS